MTDYSLIRANKRIDQKETQEMLLKMRNKKVYRTPLVIVLEMEKGKIKKGRHYCDPDLSYLYLTEKQIKKVYK